MSTTKQASTRTGVREPTYLTSEELRQAGAELESAVRKSGLADIEIVGLMGLDRGPDRLRSYYTGERLLKPKTLRSLSRATNGSVSYVEFVDRYGFYREIIGMLDDLMLLGDCWYEEDWGVEAHIAADYERGFSKDPQLRDRYFLPLWYDAQQVLTKASAVAIILTVLIFPRRGDEFKEVTPPYREALSRAAEGLIEKARRKREESRTVGRPKSLHPLLKRTITAFDDHTIAPYARRCVAAEYAIAWAGEIWTPFTTYARQAAFKSFGRLGFGAEYGISPRDLPLIETLIPSFIIA
jgi:hypothetical protein